MTDANHTEKLSEGCYEATLVHDRHYGGTATVTVTRKGVLVATGTCEGLGEVLLAPPGAIPAKVLRKLTEEIAVYCETHAEQ